MTWRSAVAALVLSIVVTVPASGSEPAPRPLEVGDTVPAFQATSDTEGLWKSSDHVGKKYLVVYFYPAAMTGGCTKQACAFRDNRSRLQQLGAEVVGVSGDRVENLKVFRAANRINFPLLADTKGDVARAFGVPMGEGGAIKRTVAGEEIELVRENTPKRWTFIVDRSGKVVYRDTEVNPEGDGEKVVKALEKLTS